MEVLRVPSSNSPATVQEAPVMRRQLRRESRSKFVSDKDYISPHKERFSAPDINEKSTEQVSWDLEIVLTNVPELSILLPPLLPRV